MDKVESGIVKATRFVQKVNHVLSYVVIIAWSTVPIAIVIKLLIKFFSWLISFI